MAIALERKKCSQSLTCAFRRCQERRKNLCLPLAGISEIMSDNDREDHYGLPKINVFDGNAEDDLDADESYQRWARRHWFE